MTKYLISGLLALTLVATPALAANTKIKPVNERKSLFSRLLNRFNKVEDFKPGSVFETPITPRDEGQVVDSNRLSLISSNPPSGAIRTGQPSNPDGTAFWDPKGAWQMIQLVMGGNTALIVPEMFEITSTSADTPRVAGIIPSETTGVVTLAFSYPIQIGWTTITFKPTGQSINLGYLPGDVDQSGVFTAADWLKLIDALNGVADLPLYMTDIDNSGVFTPADLLRLIDMINGADHYAVLNLFGSAIPNLPVTSN